MHLQLHSRQSRNGVTRNCSNRLTAFTKAMTVVAASLLTMSCASSVSQNTATVVDRSVNSTPQSRPQSTPGSPEEQNAPNTTATRDINVERAEYYQNLASSSENQARIDAQLNAAENYIQAQDFYNAEQQSISLQGIQLNKTQSDRLAIVNAYIQYQRQDYTGALQILSSVTQGLLSPTTLQPVPLQSAPLQPTPQQPAPQQNAVSGTEASVEETPPATRPRQNNQPLTVQQVDALLLSSFCYQKLGNYDSAIAALLKREGALIGKARTETTRYIWQVINTIDTNQRTLMINTTNNPLVRNRLEQSLQGQVSQNNIEPSQFTQWQAEPISETVQTVDSNWSANSPRKIAVLLPLGSKFNKAAQALMDGIKYQNELNSSPYRPQIQFYDIGQILAR